MQINVDFNTENGEPTGDISNVEEELLPSDIDDLLAIMKREARKQRLASRYLSLSTNIYCLLFLLWPVLLICGVRPSIQLPVLNIITIVPTLIIKILDTQSRKRTVEAIAKVEDLRIVGPLCDVFSFQDTDMRRMAETALIGWLPRLKFSDARLLNAEQRKALYLKLTGENVSLVLAILKALEQIGDEKAVPYVEKLSEGKYHAKQKRQIQEAAEACLPFLRERVEAQRVGQDLLRASGPELHTETLLRPASALPDSEPQHLLRASHNDTT